MNTYSPRSRFIGGQTLIGLLIVIAIMAGLGFYFYGGGTKDKGSQAGIYKSSMDRAEGVACGSYVSQIRQAIMQYKQDYDGKNPPNLQVLTKYGVVKDMYDGDCHIGYDPVTGNLTPAAAAAPGTGPASGPAPGTTTIPGGPTIKLPPAASGGM